MSLPSPAEIAAALVARDEMPPEKGDIGPQGMEGKAGEFGPPGPQGAKGDPGRDGTNGSNGDIGPVGPQGPGGPRGLKGDKGDKGDEGERGIQGPQGETGAVGSGRALFPRAGGGSGGGAPSGAAGGDLSGTYPNPGVVDDSHSHGAGTAPGSGGTQDIAEVLTEGSVAETGQAIFWRNLANNADIQMLRVFGTEFTTDPGNFYDTQQVGRDIIIDDFFTGQINVFDKAIGFYGTPASGYPHIFDGGADDPEAATNGPYAVAQRTSFVVNGADGVRTSQIDLTGFAATGTGSVVIALRAQSGSVIFDLVGLPTADPATAGRVWNNLGVLMVSAG